MRGLQSARRGGPAAREAPHAHVLDGEARGFHDGRQPVEGARGGDGDQDGAWLQHAQQLSPQREWRHRVPVDVENFVRRVRQDGVEGARRHARENLGGVAMNDAHAFLAERSRIDRFFRRPVRRHEALSWLAPLRNAVRLRCLAQSHLTCASVAYCAF
jgi:hypothetical protein